jgi:hypothetical protein
MISDVSWGAGCQAAPRDLSGAGVKGWPAPVDREDLPGLV